MGGKRDAEVGSPCCVDRQEFGTSEHRPVTEPALIPTRDHSILVEVAGVPSGTIVPFSFHAPEKVWNSTKVKMPFSTFSKQTVAIPGQQRGEEVDRWDVIREALNRPHFNTANDLESAIKRYNPKYSNVWRFVGLCRHVDQMQPADQQYLLGILLPQVAKLALQAPHLCQKPVPLLTVGMRHALTMSQEQCACLLANAFFCTFPHRNSPLHRSEFFNYPTINFSRLFESPSPRTSEKLKAIFCYFKSVVENTVPNGLITFQRCGLSHSIEWRRSQCKVTQLHLSSVGTIEDDGRGMLQVDFAAPLVGGGVLGHGLVQEEIRFLINPELIVARLFTERLADTECLIVTGAQRYSEYTGYSDTFHWARAHLDSTPRDSWLRRCTDIVAMDAVKFDNPLDQYSPHYLERELVKAFCGFSCRVIPDQHRKAIATGNWGCGAFKGDVKLKALIQILAAAQAHRDVTYFTFGSNDSTRDIRTMHRFLKERNVTVGQVYSILEKFWSSMDFTRSTRPDLYEFMQRQLISLRGRY